MTPFQEFRLWSHGAPAGEKLVAASVAAVLAVAAGWVAVPAERSTGTSAADVGGVQSAQQSAGGAPAAGSATARTSAGQQASNVVAPGAVGVPAASAASANGASATGAATAGGKVAGGGCVAPPGTDQGVTSTQIKVAITLVDV